MSSNKISAPNRRILKIKDKERLVNNKIKCSVKKSYKDWIVIKLHSRNSNIWTGKN